MWSSYSCVHICIGAGWHGGGAQTLVIDSVCKEKAGEAVVWNQTENKLW